MLETYRSHILYDDIVEFSLAPKKVGEILSLGVATDRASDFVFALEEFADDVSVLL